jgi:hypothetical protein
MGILRGGRSRSPVEPTRTHLGGIAAERIDEMEVMPNGSFAGAAGALRDPVIATVGIGVVTDGAEAQPRAHGRWPPADRVK